jgi:hypothetical protein
MTYDNIMVVPIDFNGVGRHMRHWLDTMPNVRYASDICFSSFAGQDLLAIWRNKIAEWFIEKTDKEFLLMVDDDNIPMESIYELLDSPADVSGCHFFSRTGKEGHSKEGVLSLASLKVSRRALERIERPWFKFEFNENHTEMIGCECNWFCRQARAAGIFPIKIGVIAHVMKVALIPSDKADGKCLMKFLQDIPLLGK